MNLLPRDMEGIFSRFSVVLQNAVDALAPPVPLLDDFIYHWKMLLKFYMNKETVAKTSIEGTNIPARLDQLLKLLLEEEVSSEAGSTGPCLEYLLQHHLLDLLATLACTDCPPGMKQYTFTFVRRLLMQTKQPILPHVGIHIPVQRLIGLCCGTNASPTEQEEIHFLCTLCALLSNDTSLVNVFISSTAADQSTSRKQKEVGEAGSACGDNNLSTPATQETLPSSSLSSSQVPDSEASPARAKQTSMDEDEQKRFLLLDALLTFFLSADTRVMVKACEGVMVISSLSSDTLARLVAEQSNLCMALVSRLQATFQAIPLDVDPNDLDDLHIKWGLDTPLWGDSYEFHGCRPIAAFLGWLDYCNQLVREAHPIIGSALANSIRNLFLENVLEKLLIADDSYNPVLATAFITKCLKQTTAPALLTAFIFWLIGENTEPELPGVVMCQMRQHLLDNCLNEHDELSLETLRLFEVLIEKPHEHILQSLVFTYLKTRGYYNTEANDLIIQSWSDEEDEREKNKDSLQLDFSPGSSPISRTLAPSNIHRVINSFLFLLPQHLCSADDPTETGYQQYVQDADRGYRACLAQSIHNSWPVEATFPECALSDDSDSEDSHSEANHHKHFYEGAFLNMILMRLLKLPYQPYEINLKVTGLVSRLAMWPHPYLHEFILNPLLPLVKGANSIFTTLQGVVDQLVTQIPLVKDYQSVLLSTRHKLLGADTNSQEETSTLFESVIVLEEFSKELAAIAFVKYHHSS